MISSAHRLGAAMLTALLLAACGDEPQPTPAQPSPSADSPSAPAVPSAVTTSTGPPPFTAVEVNDLAKLCGTGEHRATPSRPHAGPGPHPIVAFSKDAGQGEYTRDYLVNRDGAEFDPQQPGDVALLACITGVKTSKRVGTCRYKTDSGTRSVRVDAQRFTIDIFALDTGRRVGRKTFQADFCPPGLVTLDGGADIPKQMYSTMTIDDRAKTLDPYVKGAA
jgi:hypothetical protein